MRRIIFLGFFFILTGCPGNDVTYPGSYVEASLNQEFNLKIGETALIKNEYFTVRLDSIPEDSRCPEGAVCVWAGNGRTYFTLNRTGASTVSASLNTYLEPKAVSYSQYAVRLIKLSPYPRLGALIKRGDYVVTLLVSKMQ